MDFPRGTVPFHNKNAVHGSFLSTMIVVGGGCLKSLLALNRVGEFGVRLGH
jgi:hypothetical protein